MRHSKQHGGLQDHSVGELYPWSIVQVGDQFIQARHGITGEQGPEFTMESMGSRHAYKLAEHWVKDKLASSLAMAKHAESVVAFQQNKACESDDKILRCAHGGLYTDKACESAGKRVDGMRELSALQNDCLDDVVDDVVDEWKHGVKLAEYSFVVPIHNDNNEFYPPCEFNAIEHKLLAAFDGFSVINMRGSWTNEYGETDHDTSRQYSVAFKSTNANIDKLLGIVAHVKARFDQEKIYISQDSSNVRLV